jgi:acyl transferase domain-containing protein/NAD(P)H-dependent flavin oxidoreductase YrpB (nitropropane dioxygenase family)/NAD(P)-dependent dehydrogenase (short-subunit alcohol dehydrogenase family)/acyl carrier protein
MNDLEILVVTPPVHGAQQGSLAIAASRAGARGLLDLEFTADAAIAAAAIERVERFTQGVYGVKLGPTSDAVAAHLLAHASERLACVLLSGGPHARLTEWAQGFRRLGIEILVECVSVEEMRHAIALQADGVILKGQETGGRAGAETAFILLQHAMRDLDERQVETRPAVFVQGGVGLHTAAACAAAGAAGVVLDAQLLQLRESPLSANDRRIASAFDGSETLLLGERLGEAYRVYSRPRCPVVEQLQAAEERIAAEKASPAIQLEQWRATIHQAVRSRKEGMPVLLGQDAALGKTLAERFVTVGGVIEAIRNQARQNLEAARRLQPLAEGAPLAESHGTRYPLLQGPMTRVSDTAAFADAVARAGALPFLALAMLRKGEVEKLLTETQELLEDRPWGVGILGFLPPEIRKEQLDVVHRVKPPFALIAGGRPDQAQELEKAGIPTYLHVPSPGLLKMFLKDGARRFIFEGRECGGHVGPRSSFVLWETMCQILLDHVSNGKAEGLHVVFAGGVHDALSASMVAALAAPLAEKGIKVGALMGTAYLFTQEAVAAGAIVPRFQQEALKCEQTVLLETAPGHAIRCVPTPYFDVFDAERRRLRAEGKSHEEIVKALEWMNIGRLRVASKGVDRIKADGAPRLVDVSADEQYQRGMYMIGQIATMRDRVLTMAELHDDVCGAGAKRLERFNAELIAPANEEKPCDIAIVGMACFYPGATGVSRLWHNVLRKHYAVTEIPATHWDWSLYYSEDSKPQDKFVSKWGGFLDEIHFDPFRYGITPKTMEVIEPLQMFLLEAVRLAIDDAGYTDRPFNRDKTAAILGIGGGGSPLGVSYGFRTCLPLLDQVPGLGITSDDLLHQIKPLLPTWTEDSFPGILMNVAAGRVANRFNFGGPNYAMDAACASSLAAMYNCIRELETGASDVAIAMGADTVQTPYSYMAFSKTHALSKQGRCRPFDEQADGIVLSEGISAVVLKRLADAQRDGDRIYAVIRGMGCSSDGKEKGLTAPNARGQLLALRRAYAKAGVSPTRLELIEAHGTGTVAGDKTEAEALSTLMVESGATPNSCALGSVKSMIGHSKCAAGLAGLIKTTLALHKKTLPPTLVETPNKLVAFDHSPLYLNTEARPWIHGGDEPRLAGVSAFGFGGTNYHVVLEEYTDDFLHEDSPALDEWPTELCVWQRSTRKELADALRSCRQTLLQGARPELRNLAASLWKDNRRRAAAAPSAELATLAVVATTRDDLCDKLDIALKAVESDKTTLHDPRGVYFAEKPSSQGGKLAFLFPGQGSQYPNMLAQQAMNFAEVRQTLDHAEGVLADELDKPLGKYIYPPSAFGDEAATHNAAELTRTEIAQPALGAADLGMFRLLKNLGLSPDFAAGHSYGEYAALAAAGVLSAEACIRLSHLRGRLIAAAAEQNSGGMAVIEADETATRKLFIDMPGVTLANLNSPQQTVIAAAHDVLDQALERCKQQKVRAKKIPVACAFHSPLVAKANAPLADALRQAPLAPAQFTVFSNTTAQPYPTSAEETAALLAQHLVSPVRFQEEIEAMYAAGARVFVEVGPQGVLTNLVTQTLAGRPHVAAASDIKGRDGLTQLCHLLGQLLVHGAAANLDRLFAQRDVAPFELSALSKQSDQPEVTRSTWVVNSVRAKPLGAKEPLLLGQKIPAERYSEFPGKLAAAAPAPAEPSQTSASPKPVATKDRTESAAAKKPAAPTPPSKQAAPPQKQPTQTSSTQAETIPAMHSNKQNGAANGASKHEPAPPAPPAPLPAAPLQTPAVGEDQVVHVMQSYHNLMARFLEAQRSVMITYLQGDAGPAPAPLIVPGASVPPANGLTPPAAPSPAAITNGSNGHYRNGHSSNGVESAPPAVAAKSVENGHAPAKAESLTKAESHKPTNRLNTPATPPAPQPEAKLAKVESAPEAAKPPTAKEPTKAGFDRETVSGQLLDLVSERTGYPHDMLDVDLDLEADLGIDSIKRVEILGNLAEILGITQEADSPKIEFERLTSIRTIRGILDYLQEALSASAAPAADNAGAKPAAVEVAEPEEADVKKKAPAPAVLDIQRGLIELIDAPLPSGAAMLIPSGAVLITDDGRGVAAEVAHRLADFGQEIVLIRHSTDENLLDRDGVFYGDLTREASVIAMASRIRKAVGAIGGLIHLLPLADHGSEQPLDRMAVEVKGLYLLARELEEELQQAGRDGGALLLAATSLGGGMGFDGQASDDAYFAGHGGVAGFLKCLGQEWPDVLVRTVDVNRQNSVEELAECLLAELSDRQGPREVGYLAGRRVTWQAADGAFDLEAPATELIDSKTTLLVTGGGRGITSAIAEELARRYQPNLVLVGRSPAPEGEEAGDTARLQSPAEIKAALIARFKREGQQPTPVAVQVEFARIMRDREIRGALERMQAAGSQVIYRSADARDEAAMAAVIAEAQARFGGIDGVIHGAGVIEDKLLTNKSPESFDRVFGSKVESALLLSRLLDLKQMKFFALFASVASRYGNRGQSDYAAANEVLAKLAWQWDRQNPCRVFAVDWGPWSGIGMVSELEKHLVARGLKLIDPDVGVQFFVEELRRGRKGESEVIVGGGAEHLVVTPQNEAVMR